MRFLNFGHPAELLGRGIKVFLKDGGAFFLKVTECGDQTITGFDDEYTPVTINLQDIEYVMG